MRALPGVAAAALVVLSACAGGDATGFGPPPTTAAPVTSSVPPVTASTTITVPPVTDPAGSVTLRVTAFTLPDLRSGGTGLRVFVRAEPPRLSVRRRGGGGAIAACPVTGTTAAATAGECVELTAQRAVELTATGGVEVRATGAEASIDEVTVTYVAASRLTTLVTPARPSGACSARACEATFSLLPAQAGAFVLDGRAGGGRSRWVLTAVPAAGGGGSNRTVATVEGGGSLSIRGTLDPGTEARLLHHEQGDGPVAAVIAEILWP